MIVFITRQTKINLPVKTYTSEKMIKKSIRRMFDHCAEKYDYNMGMDYEANGLDPYINDTLLVALGSPEHQLVIDTVTINWTDYLPDNWRSFTFIAQNAKYEYKMTKQCHGVEIDKWYCTQVGSQRIWQNMPIEHNLVAICMRELGEVPEHMIKDIRQSFIGVAPEKYTPLLSHIHYVAADIEYLHKIRDAQLIKVKKYNMDFMFNNISMPLIPVLGDMEMHGFVLKKEQLLEAAEENKRILYNLMVSLDNEVLKLRDELLPHKSKEWLMLTSGKYTHKRLYQDKLKQGNLFGGYDTSKRAKIYEANTNYGSSDQVLRIFGKLGQPAPTQCRHYLVPIINDNDRHDKSHGLKPNGERQMHTGFTLGKDAIATYMIKNPKSPMNPFLLLYVEHNRIKKEVSTYGENMIDKVNKITGKIHSAYRQCSTANGRLASGGGKADPDKINQQNIPRLAKFRTAFGTDVGRLIGTADLSGAELTIMCSQSNDLVLRKLAEKDDVHSPLVTNGWRRIFLYRAGELAGLWHNYKQYKYRYKKADEQLADYYHIDGVQENHELSRNFLVNKKVNAPYRQSGKNCNFGSIYNMGYKKAAETYNGTTTELRKKDPNAKAVNVTPEEGKVALHAIREYIPTIFKHVEKVSIKAFNQGYLTLNTRTNSRIWFNDVLLAFTEIKGLKKELARMGVKDPRIVTIDTGKYIMNSGDKVELKFPEYLNVDGGARNIPISGTQADMLKEAMVVLHKIIKAYDIDIRILGQVHDELIFDFKEEERNHMVHVSYLDIEYLGTLPELVPHVMKEVANRYLENGVTMGASLDIAKTWVK